ncbi:MAG: PilZ domain-containing protein [bacterium]|nr:PilZ domain-containing protein [bacterium]
MSQTQSNPELSVCIRTESVLYRGMMVDTGPASLEVDFPILTAPELTHGDCTSLVISGRGLRVPVEIPAEVDDRDDGAERRRFRFTIDYEGGMALANVFNRRKSFRVPIGARVNVALQLQGIVAPVEGVLRDLSRDGAAVHVEAHSEEERLYETESLSMSFVLPGAHERTLVMGIVRHRRDVPGEVHYGIEFLSQPTHAYRETLAALDKYVDERQAALLKRFECSPLA